MDCSDNIKNNIIQSLQSIDCIDSIEQKDKIEIEQLLKSNFPYVRIDTDIPEKHIVCVLLIMSQSEFLLGYHRKAADWLPFGGHLEKNESILECAFREFKEEITLTSVKYFYHHSPFFVSQTKVNSHVKPHTDVGFWFIIEVQSPDNTILFCEEFSSIKWFPIASPPNTPLGHNLPRALKKALYIRSSHD